VSTYNACEHRSDRHAGPSTIINADGSLICATDSALIAAMLRLVLAQRLAALPPH